MHQAVTVKIRTLPVGNNVNRQRGFSLLEVVVVLTLLALITTLVGTGFIRGAENVEVRTAAQQLVNALRYTRAQAMLKQQSQRLTLDLDNKTYRIPVRQKTVALPKSLDVTLLTAESELTAARAGAIRFFPDGSSTGGQITLSTPSSTAAPGKQRQWQIAVTWLTGEATLSESR